MNTSIRAVAWPATIVLASALQFAGCQKAAPLIDGARIANPAPGEWPSHGRGYDKQRFSPLDQVTEENVGQLGLAWWHDIQVPRGAEATPLVANGVIYITEPWSIVQALDARTGKPLWRFDPEVPREKAHHACCDVVNRGVALWHDSVFVATLDGRLIALDAKTGELRWTQQTFDPATTRTITGAPRVVRGRVVIGHGGAEYGVRGYVSAYDAETGDLSWRFYTVPGDPSAPPDGAASDKVMAEKVLPTWNGEWWKFGGGGTVWDSMAYDPELDLLYVGVGNGSPWNHQIRSAGKGDNLFLASIVALRPETGAYVWHYQTTPAEQWDYTATQHIVLADLEIAGARRKVLMQAPKNGFFYVLDRATGELISAAPYVPVNWASGIDLGTGRPIENPEARYGDSPMLITPGPFGGHNWHPMAFHPQTGLVYIPTLELPFPYARDTRFEMKPGRWNHGIDSLVIAMPDERAQRRAIKSALKGDLIAWDPALQKEAWRVPHTGPNNGGVLATAGNLVFQGTADARFAAYRATDGEKLWEAPAQAGIVAAPISYEIDGEQYVAVVAGWGGAMPLIIGALSQNPGSNARRLLVYKLGAKATLPAPPAVVATRLAPPPAPEDAATILNGKRHYQAYCAVCHGDTAMGNGILPDLRFSPMLQPAAWKSVVLDGARAGNGMVSFRKFFGEEEAEAIRAYVTAETRAELAEPSG
ncbi:MAG: PQQ-dependent dehydrogenase, methanol/ethanol family [Gammaproteobacteria bacterium]